MPKIVCVIPSRYQSSRFPGKPLADLCGKPMIQHVYERALHARDVSLAIVATDDERIFKAVEGFGGNAVMTSAALRSGTDRIAAAVENIGLADDDIVVNIQGDQPLFEPRQIGEVVAPLLADPSLPMSTLIYRIVRAEEIVHPNAVKVAFDHNGFALYFSRATIPFVRDQGKQAEYFKHHGIYAYRRDFLRIFAGLPDGTLENLESLEQLRVLEYGYRIKVIETIHDSVEVDTPEELARVGRIIRGEKQTGGNYDRH
ncbi:MAG: 3-deoxy-manno-octulosonate cytidylyltransferase [Syntrophobacterales bacterium]|nr:3-deoxy-manno-octulosonate cytidylyltransferase [Syntrophobacterales bacterium]